MPARGPERTTVRELLKNAALALASVLLSLLMLELGVRWVQGDPLLGLANLTARRVALLETQTANEYHPVIGWVLKPHLSAGESFSSGELGLRSNKPGNAPPPRGAILAVGDSFTAGSEVSNRDTWPAQLERALGEPVLNAATGGWGSDQIVLRAESLIPVLAPKAIIVSFLVDDIERAGYRVFGGANKPYFLVEDGRLVHMNNPVPVYTGSTKEIGLVRSLGARSALVGKLVERFGNWPRWLHGQSYVTVDNDYALVSCLLLRRLKAESDAKGMRLIFLLQYGGGHIAQWDREPSHALRVSACARADGIETVNSWAPLKAVLEEQGADGLKKLYVMHDNGKLHGHMSAAGNGFIAGLLERQIRALPSSAASRRADFRETKPR
jgi:lysophospholipase L1-like esterase